MSKDKEIINFGLHKVATEQFAIISDPPSEDKDITLNTNYRFGSDVEHKAIATFLKFSFNNKETPFLLIEVSCQFIIEDESWNKLLNHENKNLTLPKGFASHLIMICMGTARGILHSKTENTPYNKFILPLMNVAKMVKENIEVITKENEVIREIIDVSKG